MIQIRHLQKEGWILRTQKTLEKSVNIAYLNIKHTSNHQSNHEGTNLYQPHRITTIHDMHNTHTQPQELQQPKKPPHNDTTTYVNHISTS